MDVTCIHHSTFNKREGRKGPQTDPMETPRASREEWRKLPPGESIRIDHRNLEGQSGQRSKAADSQGN